MHYILYAMPCNDAQYYENDTMRNELVSRSVIHARNECLNYNAIGYAIIYQQIATNDMQGEDHGICATI